MLMPIRLILSQPPTSSADFCVSRSKYTMFLSADADINFRVHFIAPANEGKGNWRDFGRARLPTSANCFEKNGLARTLALPHEGQTSAADSSRKSFTAQSGRCNFNSASVARRA